MGKNGGETMDHICLRCNIARALCFLFCLFGVRQATPRSVARLADWDSVIGTLVV